VNRLAIAAAALALIAASTPAAAWTPGDCQILGEAAALMVADRDRGVTRAEVEAVIVAGLPGHPELVAGAEVLTGMAMLLWVDYPNIPAPVASAATVAACLDQK